MSYFFAMKIISSGWFKSIWKSNCWVCRKPPSKDGTLRKIPTAETKTRILNDIVYLSLSCKQNVSELNVFVGKFSCRSREVLDFGGFPRIGNVRTRVWQYLARCHFINYKPKQ